MGIVKLKEEAEKLGYHLIKKQQPIRLLKCTCGTRPVRWWYGGYYYECPNCDKKSEGRRNYINEAKLEWNRMIEREMENGDNKNRSDVCS